MDFTQTGSRKNTGSALNLKLISPFDSSIFAFKKDRRFSDKKAVASDEVCTKLGFPRQIQISQTLKV